MKLIQILLPLTDNDGRPHDPAIFQNFQHRLIERYGGLTAYGRAPAEGVWASGGARIKDDIVVVEVMAEDFDRAWWQGVKSQLEAALDQAEIVVRAQPLETL